MEPNSPQQVERNPLFSVVLGLGSKHALKSKTIVGALSALIFAVLRFSGVELVDEDASDIFIAVGCAVAIYGRIRAKQPIHVAPASKTGASVLLLFAFAAVGLLYLTGCGSNGGTRWVESVGLNGSVTREEATDTTTGTGAVVIRFRDGRDAKTIKPLSLRDDVLDESTDLGGPLRIPFRLDIETMDERFEQLVVAPDGLALVVPKL